MITSKILNLLRKYRENTLTIEEFNALKKWISEAEENRLYMSNFIRFYKIEDRWNAYKKSNPEKAWEATSMRYHKKKRLFRMRLLAAACTLLFVVAGGIYQYAYKETSSEPIVSLRLKKDVILTLSNGTKQILKNGGELVCNNEETQKTTKKAVEEYNTIHTEVGGNFKLILPDKSTVWINSNTTLKYPVKFNKNRKITLSGEAFFDVAKTGEPFYVESEGNKVRVLGTQFNVSAYSGRTMLTTLVRGKVEISNKENKQILNPSEQASISASTKSITIKKVNTTIYTSWIEGVFDFESTPLSVIMEQLAQWYDIDVIFEGENLSNVLFSGSIYRDRSLQYSLQIIEDISDVKFRNDNGKLCVYR